MVKCPQVIKGLGVDNKGRIPALVFRKPSYAFRDHLMIMRRGR